MEIAQRKTQEGFSAVELLITLFVAAAFLVTGYQLYFTVIEASGQTRLRAIANNIAYDKLRFYAAKATATCTAKSNTTLAPTIPANSGLGSATITASLTCPFGTSSTVTAVNIDIGYGPASDREYTRHVIYTTPNL
jgi:Tfp pilus assembly protein PilE